jgi:D-alanyl-D-alanine carboxypeptidase/D-alanyl-D-alanine-endopeptidase (penicillin-binding protein 4)
MNGLKKILIIFFLFNILIFPQENVRELKYQLDTLLSGPFFQSTLAAVDIYDLTSHETLYSKNEKMLLNPASNMKILTTSSALLFLDPGYRFNTNIYYTGNILNKILYGDLYIIGGGDPLFKTSDLDSLVKLIKGTGLQEISGNIYADVSWKDSLFWGDGWMWNDDPSTDAPYLSALNINENSIEVFVGPTSFGKKADVFLKPETGYVSIINKTITTYNDGLNNYEVTRDWINRKNNIIVEGLVSNVTIADSANFWQGVNIFNPAMYFTALFYEDLIKNGIKVDGVQGTKTTPEFATLLTNYYHSLDSVIVNTNKPSYNLGAEMLLYALAVQDSGKPATAKNGIAAINNLITLVGLNPDNYSLADGSGVSRYNLVSSELLLSVLKYLYENKPQLYKIFYYSLPIAGIDGTLKKRMLDTPAQNNVHAKTGTLSGVSALSGYVTSKNNHNLVFSILIQNYVGKSTTAKNYEDKICEMLAEYE